LLPAEPSSDGDPGSVHLGRRPGAAAIGRRPDLEERADWHAALDRALESLGRDVRPGGERHRLEQRGCDDAVVCEPRLAALVVLFDEAAARDVAGDGLDDLREQPEEVQAATPEALIVVLDYFRRNALIRTSYCCASRA
jgi:hypothetical protein